MLALGSNDKGHKAFRQLAQESGYLDPLLNSEMIETRTFAQKIKEKKNLSSM